MHGRAPRACPTRRSCGRCRARGRGAHLAAVPVVSGARGGIARGRRRPRRAADDDARGGLLVGAEHVDLDIRRREASSRRRAHSTHKRSLRRLGALLYRAVILRCGTAGPKSGVGWFRGSHPGEEAKLGLLARIRAGRAKRRRQPSHDQLDDRDRDFEKLSMLMHRIHTSCAVDQR